MKRLLIIFLLIISLLLTGLLSGCVNNSSKNYTINVSTIDWGTVNLLTGAVEGESEKAFMKDVFIKNNTTVKTLYAKKVISYSDTSVRFMDNTGEEQFISADHITITQTK